MNFEEMFLDDFETGEQLVAGRGNKPSAKDGQLCLEGQLENYIVKTGEGNGAHNATRDTPPPTYMKETRDKKKTYPAAIEMRVKLTSLTPEHDKVVRNIDPATGNVTYLVAVKISPLPGKGSLPGAKEYLESKADFAWKHNDPESLYIREYVTADKCLITRRWYEFSAGDSVKVTSPDSKNNIFRKTLDTTNNLLVQPGAPLNFINVEAEGYVAVVENEINEQNEEGAAVQRKELKVITHLKFSCKNRALLGEDYDAELSYTERLHETERKDVHNLAPIAVLRENSKCVPSQPYFYVAPLYMTKWSPDGAAVSDGVTIMREKETSPAAFFYTKDDGEEKTAVRLNFNAYQWSGRPHTEEKYNVKVIDNDKTDSNWRAFGIFNKTEYSMIMAANVDLPLHLTATLWANPTLKDAANIPEQINNKQAVANMRGYYTYGVKKVTPDYLRYFKTRGLRISPARVAHEFRASSYEQNGKLKIQLLPDDTTKLNPVNTGGMSGAVLSIGNGKTVPRNGEDHPFNHAWLGNLALLLEGGKHDFYAMTSHVLSPLERAPYIGANSTVADALLDEPDLYYWIFAVRKDAKMASNYVPPTDEHALVKVPGRVVEPVTPVKRARSSSRSRGASEASESGGESESSDSGTPTSRRTRSKKN